MNNFDTEVEAVKAWNRAMGALLPEGDPQKNNGCECSNITERTAKVERCSFGETLTYDFDGQCECGKWVDALWDYCPSCGARLEWK